MSAISAFELEDDTWWTARAVLSSWCGFQSRNGAYGSRGAFDPSAGEVKFVVAPEGRGNEPLQDREIAMVQWLLVHEAAVSMSLLDGLLKRYPQLQEQYDYSNDEKLKYMPDVESWQGFRELIGLHSVNVHPIVKGEEPYLGFELGCTWGDEHGLGVLMHGTRVVEIGGADTAILLWIAERDAERPN